MACSLYASFNSRPVTQSRGSRQSQQSLERSVFQRSDPAVAFRHRIARKDLPEATAGSLR